MAVSKIKIEKNLRQIRQNIAAACKRSGRGESEVSIVAVTKMVEFETLKALLDLGVTDLGENRIGQLASRSALVAEHLRRRRSNIPDSPRWHMIGHLQRNKAKSAVAEADVIHSVDSLRLAEEINNKAEQAGKTCDILLQINCSLEPQKHGVAVGAAVYLSELVSTMKNLRLLGLMTMAPLVKDPEQARPAFIRLRELFEEMRHNKIGGSDFRHLSMGMSQDYTVAVEEGATMLRIGTALFSQDAPRDFPGR